MMSDCLVKLTCDLCGHEEDFEMTALAGGGYDDRGVQDQSERMGWEWVGLDIHWCETCADSENEDEED